MKANLSDAQSVMRTLEASGHQAFLAGGCVRDMLLNLVPNDYDVATSATPEQVQSIFPRNTAVGASFGVIKVIVGNDNPAEIDVATFRIDRQYSDNRRPDSVIYSSSPEEDVKRRDFTINAMLMNADGQVFDYVGGQDDLKRRIIRTVGNPHDRFGEDALRMMRAIRFSMRFSMEIEDSTKDAIDSRYKSIKNISAPRVTEELQKTFSYGNVDRAFWMLLDLGIWEEILPTPYNHRILQSMKVLSRLPRDTPFYVYLFVIIGNAGYSGDRTKALEYLTLTREDKKGFESIESKTDDMLRFMDLSLSCQRRMMQWPDLRIVNSLAIAQVKANVSDFRNGTIEKVLARQKEIQDMGYPSPLVNGDDLQAMGFVPGEAFSGALEAIHDQYLEGKITDKSQVFEYVMREFPYITRRKANGDILDLMSSCRVVAQCKGRAVRKCGNIMSFEVQHSAKGVMKPETVKSPLGCRTGLRDRYATCTSCNTRRLLTGFVRPSDN